MSFFSQVIVPRLCDFLWNKSLLARHRRRLLAGAHGDILEIGFGTGLNLPYYPGGVHKLTAVDPNPGMHRLAQKRIKQRGIEVDQHVLKGERLPFQHAEGEGVIRSQSRHHKAGVSLQNRGCQARSSTGAPAGDILQRLAVPLLVRVPDLDFLAHVEAFAGRWTW